MAEFLARLQSALADRYTIERELGAGGMATVYLAHDLRHDRQVALKVLRQELTAALGAERFHREIQIAAKLQHPNILPLLDSGEAAGLLYYAMPYVEGQSLRERLAREGALPVPDTVRILRDVVDALTEAHAHGVVHRDIKPENIMLRGRHALVTDFGVAKAVSEATGRQTLTTAGVALGTPAYMAPEQASADPHLDHRVDIYAVGAVAYELLTGRPVFMGTTPQMVLSAHVTEAPQPITRHREAVPRALEALVMRCLAKQPADRWQSAEELLPQLEALATPSGGITPAETQPVPAAPHARSRWRRTAVFGIGAVVVIAGALVVGRWLRSVASGPRHPRTAVAVLPLENLSAGGPQAYFAAGLQDEVLTQLSKVGALTVISRTSVMGYQGTTKPLRQIADELTVGTIVEGSVQVVGNRLRVNVQLIDAATDRHLWAEQYDRTLDDAFAVQSEIAQRIVEAVGATLTGAEAGAIAAAPTANPEAYRLYLQGLEYLRRPGYLRKDVESAQQLFERSLALDQSFALAHAALSETYGRVFWWGYDPSPARAARQREEAEAALRMAPALPQAHAAMGLAYYWGRRDYQRALDEFAIALKGLPGDVVLVADVGYVHRRLGNWSEALASFEKAAQLDPRDATLFMDLGGTTYEAMHRYREAVRAFDRASSLAPDLYQAAVEKGWAYARWQGQLDTLKVVLSRLRSDVDLGPAGTRSSHQLQYFLWQRQPDSLLEVLTSARARVFEGQDFFLPSALYAAWAHQLRGEHPATQAAFDSARVLLDSVMKKRPDDWPVHAARGLVLAGLGRRAEELREAAWLRESVVYRRDALWRPNLMETRALILVQVGDADPALDEIQRLLAGPSWVSVHTLRLDPHWDPIRNDPRFQALLRKYGG